MKDNFLPLVVFDAPVEIPFFRKNAKWERVEFHPFDALSPHARHPPPLDTLPPHFLPPSAAPPRSTLSLSHCRTRGRSHRHHSAVAGKTGQHPPTPRSPLLRSAVAFPIALVFRTFDSGPLMENLTWTSEQMDYLVQLLVEQSRIPGMKSGGGLKSKAYKIIEKGMIDKFGPEFSKEKIKNKLKYSKLNLTVMKEILNTSGFGYDPINKCIEVDPQDNEDDCSSKVLCGLRRSLQEAQQFPYSMYSRRRDGVEFPILIGRETMMECELSKEEPMLSSLLLTIEQGRS
ncbi:hypothetical protein EJ110_NYTH54857 [Nymphaea thermarum]|nr:hypothetical protein EJ110_NYTH54857 [Nymphaea thermarum]